MSNIGGEDRLHSGQSTRPWGLEQGISAPRKGAVTAGAHGVAEDSGNPRPQAATRLHMVRGTVSTTMQVSYMGHFLSLVPVHEKALVFTKHGLDPEEGCVSSCCSLLSLIHNLPSP